MYITVESKASQYFRSRQCLKKKLEFLWIVLESMNIRFLCYVVPGSIDHALVNELISPATIYINVVMRDEKEERKKQARSNKKNKAKQHSTPKAVTFPKKYMYELPWVGLEPTTLYTLDRALYH